MQLNVLERLMCLQALSEYKEGNFLTFKTIGSLRQKLFITEKEVEDFQMTVKDNNYTWGPKGSEPVKIEFTDGEKKLIKEQLIKMDNENRLTENFITLYELFTTD